MTCFVGPNGTGKSSVLQAFGLLKQSLTSPQIRESGQQQFDFTLELKFDGPITNFDRPGDLFLRPVLIDPEIYFEGTHEIAGQEIYYSLRSGISGDGLAIVNLANTENGRSSTAVHRALSDMRFVSAIRGLTKPVYTLGHHVAADVGMVEGVAKKEEQTVTNLAYSKNNVEKISMLLWRVSGVRLLSEVVPPQSVEISSVRRAKVVNIVSEGFGTNSLIMLLLQLTSAIGGATVMIEEPEIHLHPKAQAELASVLAEVASKEEKQVIMTTHSEHITGRLLTLVAEGTLTPDDVAIYAFEKDEEGVCTAKDLRITPDGTIEGGINDFFETNLEEMNRFVQAQFKRVQPAE